MVFPLATFSLEAEGRECKGEKKFGYLGGISKGRTGLQIRDVSNISFVLLSEEDVDMVVLHIYILRPAQQPMALPS